MRSSRSSSPSSERLRAAAGGTRRACPGTARWSPQLRARAVLILETDGEKVLGPRFVRLLEEIDAQGSVHRAARRLGLGYRHAIAWIRRAETALRRPLVERHVGGVAGGGSSLTVAALLLVRSYRRVGRALDRVVARAKAEILRA
jgi:molybdate transport system regulatory protein